MPSASPFIIHSSIQIQCFLSTTRMHNGGVDVQLHSFLTQALDAGEWLTTPQTLKTGKECRDSQNRGQTGPRVGVDVLEKMTTFYSYRNSNPGQPSPVTIRYTDYVTQASGQMDLFSVFYISIFFPKLLYYSAFNLVSSLNQVTFPFLRVSVCCGNMIILIIILGLNSLRENSILKKLQCEIFRQKSQFFLKLSDEPHQKFICVPTA